MQKNLTNQQGFTLLEVLVTLCIISASLLGILGMQLAALHAAQKSYLQSIAILQLNSMLDRLRANHSPLARQKEWQSWSALNARLLSQSYGMYYCLQATCTVKLQWQTHILSLSAHL